MTLFLARLPLIAAAALIAVVQLAPPAACCVTRAAVSGETCCRHAAAATQAVSQTAACCQSHAAAESGTPAVPPTAPGECPWCDAAPVIPAAERATAPVPFVSLEAVATMPLVADTAADAGISVWAVRPFDRTALAACAWLCVWRK